MMGDEFDRLIEDELGRREKAHQLRRRRVVRAIDSTHLQSEGKTYVNFASNNYLGLTHHPRVVEAFRRAAADGVGSGAAALITGHTDLHASAEQAIARWKGTESAVMLASGYQANHAAVQTLAAIGDSSGRGVRFLLDKLAHASLVDAVRGSGQEFRIFPHNGLEKLARLLGDGDGRIQVVVTESIFSMDGDAADLTGLAQLKQRHGFVLLLDEAHGSGVYGPDGAGYAAEVGLGGIADVSVVTLSKAVGVSGGAVCGSKRFCEMLVNAGRAFIYSTNVAPAIAAAVEAALGVMRDEPWRQARVRESARRVRREMWGGEVGEGGVGRGGDGEMGRGWGLEDSPIIPVLLGEADRALAAAERLREAGLMVVAVRPPTVPQGSSRLRVTVSCDHGDADLERLILALRAARAAREGPTNPE